MIFYIFLTLLVVGIAKAQDSISLNIKLTRLFRPRKKGRRKFLLVFFILGAVSILRDGIGIDYISYIWHIENIQAGKPSHMEPGFQYFARFVGNFSDNPRWVIVLCSLFTCFFYVKAIYDQSDNVVYSILIFMTYGYYFMSFNTIRGYLAISIVMYSLKYFKKKEYLKFLVLVVLASLFHKSALICIPLYFLAKCKFKDWQYLLMVLIPLVAYIFKTPIRKVYFMLYPTYEGTRYDAGRISWMNVLKGLYVIALAYFFYKRKQKDDVEMNLYLNANVFALIMYIGFSWTPEISRIGFYFNTTSMFFIPNLIEKIKDGESRRTIKAVTIVTSFALFVLLMIGWYDPGTKILPYATWLSTGF